jgi:hypothetical protein
MTYPSSRGWGPISGNETVTREKVGAVFGRLEDETMVAVNRALFLWMGLA